MGPPSLCCLLTPGLVCPTASGSLPMGVLLPMLLLGVLVLAVAGVVIYRKAGRPAWWR